MLASHVDRLVNQSKSCESTSKLVYLSKVSIRAREDILLESVLPSISKPNTTPRREMETSATTGSGSTPRTSAYWATPPPTGIQAPVSRVFSSTVLAQRAGTGRMLGSHRATRRWSVGWSGRIRRNRRATPIASSSALYGGRRCGTLCFG
jgi:hypothetical protein